MCINKGFFALFDLVFTSILPHFCCVVMECGHVWSWVWACFFNCECASIKDFFNVVVWSSNFAVFIYNIYDVAYTILYTHIYKFYFILKKNDDHITTNIYKTASIKDF